MCAERVHEYYGMASVLSGREVGVEEWAVSCVHMGGGEGGRGNGRPMNIMESWGWGGGVVVRVG